MSQERVTQPSSPNRDIKQSFPGNYLDVNQNYQNTTGQIIQNSNYGLITNSQGQYNNQQTVSPLRVVQQSISPNVQINSSSLGAPQQQQVLSSSRNNYLIQNQQVIGGSRTNLIQGATTFQQARSPSVHASTNVHAVTSNVQNVGTKSYTQIEPQTQTVNTQVIERTYEIEKPVYVERIQEQVVEEIIEKEKYVENRELIIQLQHSLAQYQSDLRNLQIQSQQVNVIHDDSKVQELRLQNRQLVDQIKYLRELPAPLQIMEKEVPVYQDEVQEVEKEKIVENVVYKEVPFFREQLVEIENFDRIRELESQIAYWRSQKPRVVQQNKIEVQENIVYQDEVQIVEKPIYKDNIILKENIIERQVENLKTNIIEVPVIQYQDIIKEVEVEHITEVPIEDVRTEFIEKEVPQIVETVEYVERPQYQTQIVDIPKIREVEIQQEVLRTVTKEKPVVQLIERVKEVPKEYITEKFIERPYNVYKTKEVEQPYEIVKDIVKKVPIERVVNQYVEVPKVEYVETVREVQVQVVKNVEVPVPIEKIVEIQEEYEQKQTVYKQVQKQYEKVEYVERPSICYKDRLVEKPVPVEKIQYIEKDVPVYKEVQIPQAVEVIKEIKVEVPYETKEIQYVDQVETVFVDKVVDRPKEVIQYVEVPLPNPVYKDVIRHVEIETKDVQYVEVPTIEYRNKIVERPYETIRHVEKEIEAVREVRVPISKVQEIVKENVEYVEVPTIEYVDVAIEAEQIRIVDRQVPVDRVVKRNQQVPAYELVFVNKPYYIEEGVERPQIQYHEQKRFRTQGVSMIAKTDVLRENIKTLEVHQVQYANRAVNSDVVQERTRQVDVVVVEKVDKRIERQNIRKTQQQLNIAETDRAIEVVKQVDVQNVVLQTVNKVIEVPEIQIIENRQNVEIEKLIEIPQIVEKQIIYQDDTKIARLEEELRLLQEKKRKIHYVELQPTEFQQRIIGEQETEFIQTEIAKSGYRASHATGVVQQSKIYSSGHQVQSYGQTSNQVLSRQATNKIVQIQPTTIVGGTRNIIQQGGNIVQQGNIVQAGTVVQSSNRYSQGATKVITGPTTTVVTQGNNQILGALQRNETIGQVVKTQNQVYQQSPVERITGNFYETSPVVNRSSGQGEQIIRTNQPIVQTRTSQRF